MVFPVVDPEQRGIEIEMYDIGEVQAVFREVADTLGYVPRDYWCSVVAAWIVANEFM